MKQNLLDCIIPKTIDRNENCSGGPLVLGFNPTDDDFSRSGPFRYDIDLEDDHWSLIKYFWATFFYKNKSNS